MPKNKIKKKKKKKKRKRKKKFESLFNMEEDFHPKLYGPCPHA
jgi:hypothetical protein